MSTKPRLLDYDPETGIQRWFHYDDTDDSFRIETKQDVSALVQDSKQLYNDHDERANWKHDSPAGHRVAQLPTVIYWKLKLKGILDDKKAFARWLNDPDNRFFRTRPGRI